LEFQWQHRHRDDRAGGSTSSRYRIGHNKRTTQSFNSADTILAGAGGQGGGVFASYNQSTNVGFIGSLSPGNAWRNLVLNPGGGNVGIGTTSTGSHRLAVEGSIGAREVVVTSGPGWSDYVFKPGYRLKPLKEIASYIKSNHHLPGIPTEAEVQEKGVSVGEMQAKLLAKVEELTLHMIQAEERNDRLEQVNQKLQARIARLEGRTAR